MPKSRGSREEETYQNMDGPSRTLKLRRSRKIDGWKMAVFSAIPKDPFVCPKEGITPSLHSYSRDGIETLNPILGRGLDS